MKHISMKCLLSICIILLVAVAPSSKVSASASTMITTEYLDNGIICETIITTDVSLQNPLLRASSTTSGSKTVNYKNANGSILWYVKVNASFNYNGASAICKTASVSAGSNNSKWKVSNIRSNRSGNTGTASATGKRYNGSTVVQTISRSVTLSCSKKGKLS